MNASKYVSKFARCRTLYRVNSFELDGKLVDIVVVHSWKSATISHMSEVENCIHHVVWFKDLIWQWPLTMIKWAASWKQLSNAFHWLPRNKTGRFRTGFFEKLVFNQKCQYIATWVFNWIILSAILLFYFKPRSKRSERKNISDSMHFFLSGQFYISIHTIFLAPQA